MSRSFATSKRLGWHSVARNSSQGPEVVDWKWSHVSSLQLEEAACASSPADQPPASLPRARRYVMLFVHLRYIRVMTSQLEKFSLSELRDILAVRIGVIFPLKTA